MERSARRFGLWAALILVLGGGAGAATAHAKTGLYGFTVLWLRGGMWEPVAADSPRLSPPMRLALQDPSPALPGSLQWHTAADGFEACQGIAPGDVQRRFCGAWELSEQDGTPHLLTYRSGLHSRTGLPIMLAAVRR